MASFFYTGSKTLHQLWPVGINMTDSWDVQGRAVGSGCADCWFGANKAFLVASFFMADFGTGLSRFKMPVSSHCLWLLTPQLSFPSRVNSCNIKASHAPDKHVERFYSMMIKTGKIAHDISKRSKVLITTPLYSAVAVLWLYWLRKQNLSLNVWQLLKGPH